VRRQKPRLNFPKLGVKRKILRTRPRTSQLWENAETQKSQEKQLPQLAKSRREAAHQTQGRKAQLNVAGAATPLSQAGGL